jgi:predicted  nucleic acid-binding Zn-ribbon protein
MRWKGRSEMSRFADSQTESRIYGIERDVSRKAEGHEVSTLRSDVHRLEHSLWEARTDIDGLRNELQTLQDQVRILQDQLNRMMESEDA